MIGKSEWFTRRKYGGWGLYPTRWQGWAYLALVTVIIFATQFVSNDETVRMTLLAIVAIVLIADTVDILAHMKKDERETLHEALAERNALWAIIFVLVAGLAFEAARSAVLYQKPYVDPVIIIALVVGVIVKASSNIYLDRKN